MEDYRLEQSGQEVQDILNGAAMQVDLTAETERATEAEQTLQGNIDIEERDRKAADLTLQGNIDAEELRAKAAEKQNADDIDALEEKVPSGASASNKLATESYVDDSVATATATFRGTYNLVSDLHLTVDATEQQIATALALAISTVDNNDYCFVQVPTSSETPTEIKEVDRYKFNGTAWLFEYKLNNSGFTTAQWAAINSGITSGDVTKLAALPTNAELTTLLNGKQDVLTFDNVPTESSNHPVKSGGVYSAIDDEKTAREGADSSLSAAIEAILLLIPSAATSLNKLADKAFVNSSIATASATFRGTYNLVTDLSLTVSATHAQIATALAGAVSDEDNNDYAFVQIPTSDATPTQIAKTERYKFNGTAWEYEYDLNNSGYTAAQWAAINSGITEALVTKLSALPTNAELTSALGVLTSSITTINQKIPSAASQANQLVDTAAMESYIVQVLDVLTASFNVTSTDGHVTVSISQVDGKITSVSVSTSDIASASDLSLIAGRVTTAEGNISTNAADIANLQDAYAALTQSALVIVEPSDTWPVASPASKTIYRVVDRVNTPPQYYSDYMWNGTEMVLMATYDNAIDDVPTAGSNNLVESGGVFNDVNSLRQLSYGSSHLVNEESFEFVKGSIENASVGGVISIGSGSTQLICCFSVQKGSRVRLKSIESGFLFHYAEADDDGKSISGLHIGVTSSFELSPDCVKLFILVTNSSFSSAITLEDYDKVHWEIQQPLESRSNTIGFIECNSPHVYVDTSLSKVTIKGTEGYCAIRYGANQKKIINTDISVTGNFSTLQYLFYDLQEERLILTGVGSNDDGTGLKNWNYILLGYLYPQYFKINCFPSYYLDGKETTSDYLYATTKCSQGELVAWLGSKIIVDTENSVLTITPGYVAVSYGNNNIVPFVIEESIIVQGNFGNLQKLYFDVVSKNFYFYNGGNTNDATEDIRKVCLGIFFGDTIQFDCFPGYYLDGVFVTKKDVGNRTKKIAVVGDSISTYSGISPDLNTPYYPTQDVNSVDKLYVYIAAKKANSEIVCLQAVSQATFQYQVNEGRNWYGWADDWVANVVASDPDMIIINLGINDVFGSITGDIHTFRTLADFDTVKRTDSYGSYQYMIMRYQTECPNAVIVCVIPSYAVSSQASYTAEKFNAMCTLIERCADYHGCQLVDLRKTIINYANNMTYKYDGIHPNVLGMKAMGEYLGARLLDITKGV